MQTLTSVNDLCVSCNEAEICAIPAEDSRRPKHFCEEFDNYSANSHPSHRTNFQQYRPVLFKAENAKYKGLCVNCENRAECVHSHTEGGIWHCEEYC